MNGSIDGWLLDGFVSMTLLVVWLSVVLLHGFWRSLYRNEPDSIRPSGPVD